MRNVANLGMNPILAMTLYGVNMECIDVNDVNEKGNHIGLQWAVYAPRVVHLNGYEGVP